MRLLRVLPLAALLLLTGCPSRPTQLLQEASTALNDAALARKCAPEEFEAAQKAFQKANDLAAEEKYDEAEEMARAAKKLAAKAEQKALMRKEECLKPENANPGGINPDEFVEQSPGDTVQMNEEDGLKTVYFDFNAQELTEDARSIIAANAAWIRAHNDKRVTIEGHCDSRGSSEYNLALGENRALVVRKYLQQLGVDVSTIEVVSYGEEQPEDYGETDAAHTRNRRATFRTR
jgi:peptidoglycan-associated lipoprotein